MSYGEAVNRHGSGRILHKSQEFHWLPEVDGRLTTGFPSRRQAQLAIHLLILLMNPILVKAKEAPATVADDQRVPYI